MEITPTFSVKVPPIPGLSLGAGVRIVRMHSKVESQGFLLSAVPLVIDTLDEASFSGWTAGGVFSALYKPIDFFSLGIVYRTMLKTNLDGDGSFATLGNFSGTLTQVIPGLLTTGLGIFPNKKLAIGFTYDFEQNSQNSNLSVNTDTLGPLTIPINWKDSHTIHLGVRYAWVESFYTSIGYARDMNSSIPDTATDRSNTDLNGHYLSAGLGKSFGKWDLNLAWKMLFGTNFVPNDGVNPVPGNYDVKLNTISLAGGYHF